MRSRPRETIALLVVLIGGTLWLVLPENPGSLKDKSRAVRWTVPVGRSLAGWVLVRNAGSDRIVLTGASVGALPAGARVIGAEVRPGHFATVDDRWPSPRAAFRPLNGFVIPRRTKATIAFGLAISRRGRFPLDGVEVRYRQAGKRHVLRIASPAVLCVGVSRRDCSA